MVQSLKHVDSDQEQELEDFDTELYLDEGPEAAYGEKEKPELYTKDGTVNRSGRPAIKCKSGGWKAAGLILGIYFESFQQSVDISDTNIQRIKLILFIYFAHTSKPSAGYLCIVWGVGKPCPILNQSASGEQCTGCKRCEQVDWDSLSLLSRWGVSQ